MKSGSPAGRPEQLSASAALCWGLISADCPLLLQKIKRHLFTEHGCAVTFCPILAHTFVSAGEHGTDTRTVVQSTLYVFGSACITSSTCEGQTRITVRYNVCWLHPVLNVEMPSWRGMALWALAASQVKFKLDFKLMLIFGFVIW